MGAFTEVVAPALAVLDDARLAGAVQEFRDALGALRQGTRQRQKSAIRDASNGVESAIKTVLDDHGITRAGKRDGRSALGFAQRREHRRRQRRRTRSVHLRGFGTTGPASEDPARSLRRGLGLVRGNFPDSPAALTQAVRSGMIPVDEEESPACPFYR